MIRAAILAACATIWIVPSALAQDVVLCANCVNEPTAITQQAQTIGEWVKNLADWERSIAVQIETYESVTGILDMMALASQLNTLAYQNPLLQMGNAISIISGNGGASDPALSAAITQLQQQNNIRIPSFTGGYPMPIMNELAIIEGQRLNSTTGMMGMASVLLTRTHQILSGLLELQADIDTMANIQHMSGINARILSAVSNVQGQMYQLQQVSAAAASQQLILDQRTRNAYVCSSVHWAANTQSLSGAGLDVSGLCMITSSSTTTTVAAVGQ